MPKFAALKKEPNRFRLVATTMAGLEQPLVEELNALGATEIEQLTRAVAFDADKTLMYKANYQLRTALRILKHWVEFKAANEHALYDNIQKLHWFELLTPEQTFSIDVVASGTIFTHSKYVAYKTKDAIVDLFRNRYGIRPSVDVENPGLRIHIHIYNDMVNVLLNSSGESLHKRGYRKAVDKSPINEVLAAGLLRLSQWKADRHFMDTMCGSGTLPIEAAMMAMNIPAGYFRQHFAFMQWKDFDPKLWAEVKKQADSAMRDFGFEIIGSDRSAKAIEVATQNLRQAKLHKDVSLRKLNLSQVVPPTGPGLMVINPPYGERLEESNLKELYSQIGDSLKQQFKGWQAWIISSDFDALKHIGLKPSKKYTVFNGPLECRFLCFDIFEGTHRDMKRRQH